MTAQIDALYNTARVPGALPAEIETAAMTRLRQEAHARMLGNGLCTRPVELECRMESACETCAYFKTGPELFPCFSDSVTMLATADRANEQPCSTASSPESAKSLLDTDHTYNAGRRS